MGRGAAGARAQEDPMIEPQPLSARLVRFASPGGDHLFVVAGSRIFDLDAPTAAAVDRALRLEDEGLLPAAAAALLEGPQQPRALRTAPPITALSLNLM